MDFTDINTLILPVGHLPLVRAAMDEPQILDVIEERCPARAGSRVTDAECMGGMILNVLSGHVALYRMEKHMAQLDAEVLLGKGVPADAFNDTRLAAMLDHVDEAGTDNVFSAVVDRYLARPDRVREYSVYQDFTSILLWGVYFGEHDPQPVHGFSKEHRPDLKQLVFGLTRHGSAGIPLVHSVLAGNTSDPAANRDHLAQLSKLLPDEDDVTVVADCKLVDADTLGRVLGAGFHLVSLVPDSYNLRRNLIDQAWLNHPELDSWPELGRQDGRRKDLPDKVYRGVSFERPMAVGLRVGGRESAQPVVSFEPMRFVVVNSTALARKFDAALPGKLDRERKRLGAFASSSNRLGYAWEEDALAAAHAQVKSVRYHKVDITVAAVEKPIKRSKRGRPRGDDPRRTKTIWTVAFALEVDPALVDQARRRGSCFVLVTGHLAQEPGWNDVRVLAEYRHQYLIEGHTGFRWLKSEAAVAPMFLKTPSRMRAMGLVLVLALMVRNYIQFKLRAALRDRKETLPHPFTKKEVGKLTTEMAFEHFAGVLSVSVAEANDRPPTRQHPQLRPPAQRIVALLGYSIDIFWRPPPRRVLLVGQRK